jgi:peptidoglycan/xylan/chitin deacetylase (PgdA/CDA1 family)
MLLYLFLGIFLLFFIIFLVWLTFFKRKEEINLPIMALHKVDDKSELGITRLKVSQFERLIQTLKEWGYETISLEEIFKPSVERKIEGKKLVLTFDDGYEDFYINAFPILQKYNFTATVFLITGYVGKFNQWEAGFGRNFPHLNWKEIKEMSRYGISFGSHTVNHPDLTKLKKQQVEYEFLFSRKTIEDKIGKNVFYLSYPFGKYNDSVIEAARKTGYKRAYTFFPNRNQTSASFYAIPRRAVYFLDSPIDWKLKLEGGKLSWIEEMKGRIINAFSNGTILVKSSKLSRISKS